MNKNNLLHKDSFLQLIDDFENDNSSGFEDTVKYAHECIRDLKKHFVRLAYYLNKQIASIFL